MTNKEYIAAILGRFGISETEIVLIMEDQNIQANEPATNKNALKKAIYYQLPLMIAGLKNVSEGGYSVSWNFEGLKLWYSALARELGLPDNLVPKPKVTGKSIW